MRYMRYTFKLLWHGSIFFARTGWILIAGFFALFGPFLLAFFLSDEGRPSEIEEDWDDEPDPRDKHGVWAQYWRNVDKRF